MAANSQREVVSATFTSYTYRETMSLEANRLVSMYVHIIFFSVCGINFINQTCT